MAKIAPLRVAFAGLAHSHPFTDAANLLSLGGEIVGVFDAARSSEFVTRFGGIRVHSLEELVALQPDVVIATPLTQHAAATLDALQRGSPDVPIFFNKVVAANATQLQDWERVLSTSLAPVGTCSVLRFAPALLEFAAAVATEELLSLRVQVQQDAAIYRTPAREWQDDPTRGGGSLVTIGVHAWEIVELVVPGAVLNEGLGWTRTAAGSPTQSEDVAGVCVELAVGPRRVPLHLVIAAVPGPGSYVVEALTTAGVRRLTLSGHGANENLGFVGLIRAMIAAATTKATVARWEQAQVVVQNTIRAAEIARG